MVSRVTVAVPSRRLKSQGFPLRHGSALQRRKMREVIFRPTKEKIRVELFVKHDVALGELLISQCM